MEKLKFHHMGLATNDITKSISEMQYFFDIKEISKIVYDEEQDANLCMVTISDGSKIELISGNQVAKLVKKRHFLYHICYETDNIEEQIKQFEEVGGLVVSEPKKAVLFGMKRVAFLMTNMGLIELVEK